MKKRLLLSSALMVALGMQAQVPKADLLDVVFQPDGTAIDVSASQRVIQTFVEFFTGRFSEI